MKVVAVVAVLPAGVRVGLGRVGWGGVTTYPYTQVP